MPNQKTLIGVNGDDNKSLFMEDITNNDTKSTVHFGKHKDIINTVFYDIQSDTLFSCDNDKKVIQYKKDKISYFWVI